MPHIESAGVASQLAVLQSKLGLHADALAAWQRFRELTPLIEPRMLEWWEGRMADARYHAGDLAGAAEAAARAKGPFFEKFAARLAAPPDGWRRVLLPVPFVRQHHMTCAPATISGLSRFLQTPIEHLALAVVVCYDGAPDHLGRHWLEENG